MPQVPYTGAPSISPNLNPTPEMRVSPPGAAFGGAEAEAGAKLGNSFGELGNELFARAYSMQQLDEQAAAINAHAAASEAIGARLVDFRSKAGIAAKNDYQPFVSDVDKIVEEQGKNLTSDYAKRLYLSETRTLRSRTIESAGVHAGTEYKNYLIGTEQARADNAVFSASLNPTDEATFKNSLKTLESSAKMMQGLKGWSDEQAQDYLQTQRSKAVFDRATTLARTDPQSARKVLDSAVADGIISGSEAGRAGDFIRSQRNTITSRVESDKLLNGEGAHFGQTVVPIQRAREAIAAVEGSGNYNPPHPEVTHKVNGVMTKDVALGRYGIMRSNLASWLEEAGMAKMSPQEFINDHSAQDKLFDFKFGQLMNKYGSANKAAMAWFTGSPNPDPKATDGGSTAPEYLAKFNKNLAKTATTAEVREASERRAKDLEPDDHEFHQVFTDKVQTEHNRMVAGARQEEFDRRQIIDNAIIPAEDGKLVTSIDQITDPKVREAWDQLQPSDRLRYQKMFAANAKGDYAATETNQSEYRQWLGRLTDPMASEEDRRKALDADYASMHMPAQQRQQLIALRGKVFSQSARNPAVSHALQVLAPMLNEAGVNKKSPEDYYNFIGSLHLVMEQRMQDGGKPLKDEEIRTIGAGLLREQSSPGWLFGNLWPNTEKAFRMEVPEFDRQRIIDAYTQSKGFAPTDQTIQQIYAARQYNLFYGKTAAPKTAEAK